MARLGNVKRPSVVAGLILAISVALWASQAHAQISPALQQKAADASEMATVVQSNGYVRVIVQFDNPVPPGQLTPDSAAIASAQARIAAVQDTIIATHFGSATNPQPGVGFARGITRFTITPGFAINVTTAELNALAADPLVNTIQIDRLEPPTLLQSVRLVGMRPDPLWYNAMGRAVAVIDTGVQSNHEFLSGVVIAEACFSNASGGGSGSSLCPNGSSSQTGTGSANPNTTQCINGSTNLCAHGTHVAGIAAGYNPAGASAGKPPWGVARYANIFAIQAFTRFNDSTSCSGSPPCVLSYTSDQISALNYVYANLTLTGGVKVASVNMSLGGGSYSGTCDSDSRKPSIDNLRAARVLTAIAAGNSGYTGAVGAPGCISSATTVGATDKWDVISSYSNMSSVVDVLAPGGYGGGSCGFGAYNNDILSSVPDASGSTNTYACYAGTSMAAPHVAGAIAMMSQNCPVATADQIETALKTTGPAIFDTRTGGTITRNRIRVDLAMFQLNCGVDTPINATHDFNNDGKSDIVWRDLSSGATAIWFVNGATISHTTGVYIVPTAWSIVGQANFDRYNATRLLWRDTSGNTAVWNWYDILAPTGYSIGNVATAWSVVGTGDFNADHHDDILWRDTSGNTAIWFMGGAPISGTSSLGIIPTSWSVAATADFDGDGFADILWHDAAGNTAIWFMKGTNVGSTGFVGNVSTLWSIVATGDFNGDGMADIVWRDTSGNVAIWLMNGAAVVRSGGLGNVPTSWSLPLTGDFDGDSKSDLLWHHSSGATAVWFMNALSVASTALLGTAPTNWTIQGMNAE